MQGAVAEEQVARARVNPQGTVELSISLLGPLVGLIAILIAIWLWQVKRWSDARPAVTFFVAGGETSSGQLFGFKIQNPGQVEVYNCSLFVTWSDSPSWRKDFLHPGESLHASVPIASHVQQQEIKSLAAWMDFFDRYGRQFRASLGLKQEWHAGRHMFFVHQAAKQQITTRPHWFRDLLRWGAVYP